MADNIELCKENECSNMQIINGYCRLHYIKHWKQLKTEDAATAGLSLDEFMKNVLGPKLQNGSVEVTNRQNDEEWITSESNETNVEGNFKDIFSNDEELDEFLEEVTLADN